MSRSVWKDASSVLDNILNNSGINLFPEQREFIGACFKHAWVGWITGRDAGKITMLACLAAVVLQAQNARVYVLIPTLSGRQSFLDRLCLLLEKAGLDADTNEKMKMCADFYALEEMRSQENVYNALLMDGMQYVNPVHVFDSRTVTVYPEDVLHKFNAVFYTDSKTNVLKEAPVLVTGNQALHFITLAHHPNYI